MDFTIGLWSSQSTHQDKVDLNFHMSKNSDENRYITLLQGQKSMEICEIHKLNYEIHKKYILVQVPNETSNRVPSVRSAPRSLRERELSRLSKNPCSEKGSILRGYCASDWPS